jgi:hypothetical protein
MCDELANTKEHVPPKCLFPERKDLAEDYRKDLIKVPSCKTHNNKKSGEDEFLMVCLAGIIGSNSIGYKHYATKVRRSLKRSSYKLLDEVFVSKSLHKLDLSENKFIDVIWGKPDYERLTRCFDHIARGLYYQDFNEKFRGSTKCILGFTKQGDPNSHEFQRLVRDKTKTELQGCPRKGSNPEVFTYAFTPEDELQLRLVHLQFYGRLDVYVSLQPDGVVLNPNLSMQLMSGGIHTIIKEGDHTYEFNTNESKNP